jgi:hypothetical protein
VPPEFNTPVLLFVPLFLVPDIAPWEPEPVDVGDAMELELPVAAPLALPDAPELVWANP